MVKKDGMPGHAKSRIAMMHFKPKWMPLWLYAWNEKRKWVRFAKKHPHCTDAAITAWAAMPPLILTGNDPSDSFPMPRKFTLLDEGDN